MNAFYFVIVYNSAVWLNSFLSLAIHEPAPFWILDDVYPYKCRAGYSSPGSQVTIATTLFFTFFSVCGFGPRACCNNWVKRGIWLVIIIFIIMAIIYAHLAGGEVGVEGQILAFLISMWTVLSFWFVFKKPLDHHIRELHEGKTRNPGLPVGRFMLLGAGLTAVFMMIGLIDYWIVVSKVETNPKWADNVHEKCKKMFEQEGMNLSRFYSGSILA